MFQKILVANRGEIACRIIRTCKKMGITSVAVYSTADENCEHVELADEAVKIGPSEASQSYLSIPSIIKAAKETKAEAIHPGYGFLSENAEFARELEKNKIVFIGPKADTIELMGDKIRAKEFARKIQMPLVPGIDSKEQVDQFVETNGFPILVKAAAGGGGRGMRKVYSHQELPEAIASAEREALAFFKDKRLFIEKLVEKGRHIEVQVFGDSFGNAIHLFDRDCTMQRKHQKVIEEAPAPFLDAATRNRILESAVNLCRESKYLGAGTVEFLLAENGEFYFLEMNSRLQVEHPVTETITDLDLVELQIKVAAGKNLAQEIKNITEKGSAIEIRLCAESPEDGFQTATGLIESCNFEEIATLLNIRVDAGFFAGDRISHYYDSLIAKIIGYGKTREEATTHLLSALRKLEISGLKTNLSFLLTLLESKEFNDGTFHINVAETLLPKEDQLKGLEERVAASYGLCITHDHDPKTNDIWDLSFHSDPVYWYFCQPFADLKHCSLRKTALGFSYNCDDVKLEVTDVEHIAKNMLSFKINGSKIEAKLVSGSECNWLKTSFGTFSVTDKKPTLKTDQASANRISNEIKSPFPGKVVSIKARTGEIVEEGSPILIVESMKMEHPLKAQKSAKVVDVLVHEGETIEANKVLVKLDFDY